MDPADTPISVTRDKRDHMAEICRRIGRSGKVTYLVRVRVAGTKPRTKTFKTIERARAWAATTENAVRAGVDLPDRRAQRRTLGELIARYEDEVLPGFSQKEQIERRGKLRRWSDELGANRWIVDIKTADISEARARLARRWYRKGGEQRPLSPATQNRYLRTLSHVFNKARREWEWTTDNPVSRLQARQEPRGRVRFLSADERRRLLSACEASTEPRLYSLAVVGLGTGARQGELLALRWRDIDLGTRRVIVEDSKNGERRTLALAGPALEVLCGLARVRRIDTDLVFAGRRGRTSFPRVAWQRALREARIQDFHFHDLRHTFASYLAMSGATLAELAEALGHKTLAMVKRYAHLTEQHVSEVVDRMTERFLAQTT
jgi:integrase